MKKLMSISIVFLVLLAFTVPPVPAAKKIWNIEYTFEGNIWDMDSEQSGRGGGQMMLTLSGKVIGSPDYEYTKTVVDEPISYGYGEGNGYVYEEDGELYLKQYNTEAYVEGVATYTEERARWYSPQSTFNGKLGVTWWSDGSTESLNVQLSPSIVEKMDRVGTVSGTYTYSTTETLYIETVEDGWVQVGDTTIIAEGIETFEESYDEANIQIQFQGKMQSKGGPPLKGTLELWDVVSAKYKIGYGEFGPYMLSIYQRAPPTPIPPTN